ncbi:hypothetical protein N24_2942 [Corynebacterium suranareeae]|uniref:Uncharacterized protein n=1 Tax=Corynebacterium suranareeae TaxID=2506452 RepID=A0A169S6D1_9CORY|nr:hypothetical protein N24_2942 [Corynebacterium suranareeae]
MVNRHPDADRMQKFVRFLWYGHRFVVDFEVGPHGCGENLISKHPGFTSIPLTPNVTPSRSPSKRLTSLKQGNSPSRKLNPLKRRYRTLLKYPLAPILG